MNIRRFTEAQAMIVEVAATLAGSLAQHSAKPFAVMLAGGQTPLKAYERLAALRAPISPQARFFLSDERNVPVQSPDSNYGRIRPFLLALRLPEERILHVSTDKNLVEAADEYDRTLREFLTKGGHLPLGLLGVGADGHTASLFSLADLERGRGRYAIAVPRTTKPDRISVTPLLLEKIDRIIFLATGSEKAAIVERMTRNPMDVIASRAVSGAHNVELWFCPAN